MTDRDRLAADLETAFGIDGPMTYEADRLIALGWTRLDEERLARAVTSHSHPSYGTGIPTLRHDHLGTFWSKDCAAAIAKAYREDTDAD